MPEGKRMKKGWLAVLVGLGDEEQGEGGELQRFTIPISHLHHPLITNLLAKAEEAFGYHAPGPLRLPCSVDDFLHIQRLIERESRHSPSYRRSSSFSVHSC